jgi:hypothetical protein
MRRACNKKLILLVFSFFLIINITSSGGHFDVWDGVETFLVTESMVLKHSAKLYPDVPSIQRLYFDIHHSVANNKAAMNEKSDNSLEPMYTSRSLFLSAIAIPFYYAALLLSISPIPVVALFANSMIISLICVVVFCFSLEIYESRKIAFVLSLIFGVCSFMWPYHASLLGTPLETLCIFAAAYFIYMSTKRYDKSNNLTNSKNKLASVTTTTNITKNKGIYFAGLAGTLLGLSVFAHPTSIMFVPGFIAYSFLLMKNSKKTLLYFLIALGIILFFAGLVNYLRFGSFTDFGYGKYETLSIHTGWAGLVGLLVSPGKGLIFYFPIALLLPLALKYTYGANKGLFFLTVYVVFASWLFFGTISYPKSVPIAESEAWSGGTWGPRYLLPILPFVTLVSGILLLHIRVRVVSFKSKKKLLLKLSLIILCVVGFYVNLLGVLVWFVYGFDYGWAVEKLWKVPDSFAVETWNPNYSFIVLQTKALISGFVSHIQPIKFQYTSYGLAPCSYDIYIFCKFGLTPILLLSTAIAIIAVLILVQIYNFNPRLFVHKENSPR